MDRSSETESQNNQKCSSQGFDQFRYVDSLSRKKKMMRLGWSIAYFILFRWTPRGILHRWRVIVLRAFGAKIGKGCRISPSCKVWVPWNLTLGDYVALGDNVDCYCVGPLKIGSKAAVSQRAFLCTATHEIKTLQRELIIGSIELGDHVWVCAEAYVGPGVTVGEGTVVGARAAVFKDLPGWKIAGGVPAKIIKDRIII